ncbi:glutamate-cysteine ligase family protein [Saccharomonospora glauca]|uniref:Glutamate--cysteine ligase EgtA n=1 Tax=Saccharomonospora glauca K62 TaxID=928724 RepID=I1D380_9PSEU|nr:glutamate-cysteine ligase family protein [Saccharomonospora glauca]EIE99404.1 gamma-glutamylcysteine synthetase [Saccharomonospora glauca K62]
MTATSVARPNPRDPRHRGVPDTRTEPEEIAARVISDRAEGEAYVAAVCFKHGPPRLLGVELEFTVHDVVDPTLPLTPARLASALGPHAPPTLVPDSPALPLPSGSALTLEPGGQVEISTAPASSFGALMEAVDADLAHVDDLLGAAGLRLGSYGIDAFRSPTRLLPTPRYAAMERRFAPLGPGGITMMCSTAAIQVCVDAGSAHEAPRRWAAAHALGPVLLSLFANSRRHAGADTGFASARWRSVMDTEPCRTRAERPCDDPAAAWARRVLDTPLLVLRRHGTRWDAPAGLTFADWIEARGPGAGLPRPTFGDLDYHLTTLFTPVRPHGYLEIRYLDAQPPEDWACPAALLAALLSTPSTVDSVLELCEPVAGRWAEAARSGTDDAALGATARAVGELGCAALSNLNLPDHTIAELADAVERRWRRRERE